jgi:peptide/nickel transport system permease protein
LLSFIVRRLIQTVIVIFLVTLLTFLLLQMVPGDAVLTMLGMESTPSQEQIDALRHELWLDRPVLVQYVHWLSNAFQGDLGKSISDNRKVTDLISQRLPITFYLSFIAFVVSTALGILLGIFSAIRRGGVLDSFISLLANIGVAVPVFWLGILCIYLLGLKLGWLSIQGFTWPTDDLVKSIRQTIMPVFCLAIPPIAVLARQTRSSMLEVVRQDYIRTAMAKGLRERAVVLRHALKNALIPVVTILGLQVRILVGGSVLVEQVFNIPGMGRLLVTAAFNRDFLVLQGGVLIIGLAVCLANLLVDLSYGWLDPRIKFE